MGSPTTVAAGVRWSSEVFSVECIESFRVRLSSARHGAKHTPGRTKIACVMCCDSEKKRLRDGAVQHFTDQTEDTDAPRGNSLYKSSV